MWSFFIDIMSVKKIHMLNKSWSYCNTDPVVFMYLIKCYKLAQSNLCSQDVPHCVSLELQKGSSTNQANKISHYKEFIAGKQYHK